VDAIEKVARSRDAVSSAGQMREETSA